MLTKTSNEVESTTTKHSLRVLAKSILNRLENQKYIEFQAHDRQLLQDELYGQLERKVWSEEHLNQRVRDQVSAASGALASTNITESDAYKSQKRALRSALAENFVQGFYLHDSLRNICVDINKFLFRSDYIEEVFESDEAIQRLVMDIFQGFDESKIA